MSFNPGLPFFILKFDYWETDKYWHANADVSIFIQEMTNGDPGNQVTKEVHRQQDFGDHWSLSFRFTDCLVIDITFDGITDNCDQVEEYGQDLMDFWKRVWFVKINI